MSTAPSELGGLRAERARPSRAREGARSLWPREHGAYGQLATPLLAALASGAPTAGSAALALGAAAAFVAHEPLLVALGSRGTRARREDGPRAARVGGLLAVVAVSLGVWGAWLGGRAVWVAAAVPVALAAALAPFVLRGAEKTTAGELLASAALAAAGVPVAVSAARSLEEALLAWAVWVVSFAASTAAVRWVVAKDRGARSAKVLPPIVAAGTACALALGSVDIALGLACAPMLGVSWWLVARPPARSALRRVGFTLLGASLATGAAVALAARVAP